MGITFYFEWLLIKELRIENSLLTMDELAKEELGMLRMEL